MSATLDFRPLSGLRGAGDTITTTDVNVGILPTDVMKRYFRSMSGGANDTNKSRAELEKMPRKDLNAYATTKGVKNLGRKTKEQVLNILAPVANQPATTQAQNTIHYPTGATTTDTPGDTFEVAGAEEKKGHENYEPHTWTEEIKAKWKDDPSQIAPEDRPRRITHDEAFKPNPRPVPFDMNKTYMLPKLDPNDPALKRITEILDKHGDKLVPVSDSRQKEVGVGQTHPFGYSQPRTAWKKHSYLKKPSGEPRNFRPLSLSARARASDLAKELNLLLVNIGRKINPLPFSSITVNVDYEAKKHLDFGNSGLSMIFALGSYTGGELCINGQDINIKHQPLLFNGKTNLHLVRPITNQNYVEENGIRVNKGGRRYSFVYYLVESDIAGSGIGVPIINYRTFVKTPEISALYNQGVNTEDIQYSVDTMATDLPYESGAEIEFRPSEATDTVLPHDEVVEEEEQFATEEPITEQQKKAEDDENIISKYWWSVPINIDEPEKKEEDENIIKKIWWEVPIGAGKGKMMTQDRYMSICKMMEGAGLLHLMGRGVSNAINVPRDKVFSTRYEQDKIYVLPPFPKNDPLLKQLEQWMRDNEIPINKSRANSGVGRSQTIGAVRQKFKTTYNDSAFTKANPDLKKLLFDIGKKYDPLAFTSVQVNQNYEAKPHIDKNNIGLSMIFAIGDFKGGHLYINDVKYDIGHSPLIFNGAKNLHYVSKITSGDRFSFVYFRTGDKALREKVQKQEG
jgi:hypothetical protein